jgi:signal transduction histidine kinase
MRERAEELGGSFEVVPSSEGGTIVRVRLPLGAG